MKETWSLDELYLGFDDPKFQADMDRLEHLLAEFSDITGQLAQTAKDC